MHRRENRRLMRKYRMKLQNPIEHKTLLFIFIKQKKKNNNNNKKMNEMKEEKLASLRRSRTFWYSLLCMSFLFPLKTITHFLCCFNCFEISFFLLSESHFVFTSQKVFWHNIFWECVFYWLPICGKLSLNRQFLGIF